MSVTWLRRALLAALLLVCVAVPTTAAASARRDATEVGIVRAMNGLRAQRGLPALRTNPGLARAADAHSASMLRSNVLAHGAFSSRLRHYTHARVVGENLAWMSQCDVNAIVQMW